MNELAPCPSQPCQPINHGLVSLWEMFELRAKEFVDAMRSLRSLELVVTEIAGDESKDILPATHLEKIANSLREVGLACDAIGAVITSDFVDDAKSAINTGTMTWGDLAKASEQFYNVLRKELARARLFAVSPQKLSYFDDASIKFDIEVWMSFPSAMDDIDEAGKCFALGRHTACVFHLMRILERPILSLAKILLPDDPSPNWGTVLKKIDAELARKPSERTFKGDVQFFSEVAAEMRAVQHAWRNRVMHIDNLVVEERAKSIFDATIGFMNSVSKKIDENGLIDLDPELDLETPAQP